MSVGLYGHERGHSEERRLHTAEVGCRRLYTAVLDGIVPAERDASGSRWLVDVHELTTIAQAFGSSND